MALRFDILPADYCLQFFQLLNQVRPFPAAAVRQIIEDELGRPVEALFRSFEWQPLAAASIGQVHRAELPDGTAVAVKIQRPGIRELVRADLRLMRWMAAIVDTVAFFGHPHAREFVREFARWTEEELDYRMEARHASVLRQNAAGDPLEHNPRVYGDYTTVTNSDARLPARRTGDRHHHRDPSPGHGRSSTSSPPAVTTRGASPATSSGTR